MAIKQNYCGAEFMKLDGKFTILPKDQQAYIKITDCESCETIVEVIFPVDNFHSRFFKNISVLSENGEWKCSIEAHCNAERWGKKKFGRCVKIERPPWVDFADSKAWAIRYIQNHKRYRDQDIEISFPCSAHIVRSNSGKEYIVATVWTWGWFIAGESDEL